MNDMRKLIESIEKISEDNAWTLEDLMDDVVEFRNNPGNFALYSEEDQMKFWQRILSELERLHGRD